MVPAVVLATVWDGARTAAPAETGGPTTRVRLSRATTSASGRLAPIPRERIIRCFPPYRPPTLRRRRTPVGARAHGQETGRTGETFPNAGMENAFSPCERRDGLRSGAGGDLDVLVVRVGAR